MQHTALTKLKWNLKRNRRRAKCTCPSYNLVLTFKIYFSQTYKSLLKHSLSSCNNITEALKFRVVITEMPAFTLIYNHCSSLLHHIALWYFFKLILSKWDHQNISRDLIVLGVWSTRRKQGFLWNTNYVQQEGNI